MCFFFRFHFELFGHVTVHMNSNMTDCDERVNDRHRRVEKANGALPVVVASEIVLCGDRYEPRKVATGAAAIGALYDGAWCGCWRSQQSLWRTGGDDDGAESCSDRGEKR